MVYISARQDTRIVYTGMHLVYLVMDYILTVYSLFNYIQEVSILSL